ncbi:hypothetical protein LJC57_03510 [Parabacteroides sp. OttesenSCG-928-G07]|nr:hypothetical protein [Parabacteroides sp. OttesenSCG-928-G21]MDL2277639.1 hypothetical protein [Parabacteroides sp. OttesenSCG-928-G07]
MKNLEKIVLKRQGFILNENEMQKILGGGSYACRCGMNGEVQYIDANCWEAAVSIIQQQCSDGWC